MKLRFKTHEDELVAEEGFTGNAAIEWPHPDVDDDGFAVYADGRRVAYSDGVNPGLWVGGDLHDVGAIEIEVR